MPDVRPEDAIGITIELTGVLGADLATVAGRETTRATLLTAAAEQVDAWMETITVKETK